MISDRDRLDALAARLEAEDEHESVRAAVVHAPRDRLWIELVINGTIICPAILEALADADCGVADTARREGTLMADIRVCADRSCDGDEDHEMAE